MPKQISFIGLAAALALGGCVAPTAAPEPTPPPSTATQNPMVGGAAMDAGQPLLQNAAKSNDHATFVSAVRGAGLEGTLSEQGQYTLFAPTEAAFARLPNGTMTALSDPSNKWLLGRLVKYHVVSGAKTRSQIAADARAGGGVATYRTLEGGTLRVSASGTSITVSDIHGNRTRVTIADVRNSNGVMHVLDGVLLPST